MFKFILILCVLLIPVGAFFFGAHGCGSVFPQESVYVEAEDPEFLRGRELVSGGRDADAMAVFQEIVRRYPNASPESNMEAGLIAFRRDNFPQAIYHFNQYLALSPEASSVLQKRARDLIDSAKKRFFREMLPSRDSAGAEAVGISLELQQKYQSVMQQNEQLKHEIARLREQLDAANARGGNVGIAGPARSQPSVELPAPEPNAVAAETPAEPERPPVPATHTVVSGDTLSSISRKYYGTVNRWRDIYQANRVTMKSPSDLKIGMVLKLPRP
ncbi:MAG: LysM peptidoglycan-binding domain-containing protein [Opitutales bacterium]|nr:LysM peptidoglycan-binding domain-containing protein [Opitutales bacterium]